MSYSERSNYWTGKRIATMVILGITIILALTLGGQMVETVEKGTYHVKQAAISGNMSVIMDTGMYLQNFGDITVWPRAETFYFTADGEGGSGDASIRVQFNDGSFCNISGSMRVTMPPDATKALGLVTINNFKTYDQLEHELILKITRNALMLTANLMSSRESYAEKRPDFVFWAWDQIEHGQYETADEKVEETDAITKEKVTKIRKIIKHGPDGKPLRQRNQLEGLGITLGNFEIKTYGYEDKVVTQISDQQEAIMAVQTARAKAAKAEQENLTKEAEGKAKVTTAKYEEMEKKARAIVQAEQEKEMAVIQGEKGRDVATLLKEQAEIEANQRLKVAELDKQAAEQKKLEEIALGEGESQRKTLVMAADGALEKKLEAYVAVEKAYAEAIAKYNGDWVPKVVMGGSTTTSSAGGAQALIDLLTSKAAKDLALDLSIPNRQNPKPPTTPAGK